ncbi:MAG: hypothetical protein ACE14V_10115 [bacterium]
MQLSFTRIAAFGRITIAGMPINGRTVLNPTSGYAEVPFFEVRAEQSKVNSQNFF